MLSFGSIRSEFAFKLVPAFGALVFIFSLFVFTLIENRIYGDLEDDLIKTAKVVIVENSLQSHIRREKYKISYKPSYKIFTEINKNIKGYRGVQFKDKEKVFFQIYYPILEKEAYYIIINKEISDTILLLDGIRDIIIYLNILAIFVIGLFSYLLSSILAKPISSLTKELSLMDEYSLGGVDREAVPTEFKDLARSINILINKIEGHINYQKELFIGLAHEIKTPLAVIKTKNSVTLMKERSVEKYIETLKSNNKTVDEMNKMTGSILDIGRAEYRGLKKSKKINISNFLMEKSDDYRILIEDKGRIFSNEISLCEKEQLVEEMLLIHIIQNFLQNAIKFTPEGKTVTIKTYHENNSYKVEIIDEGCGIDENIDPFAPFIRKGEMQGVGLGLFLVKNAANAMGASVDIKNRDDKNGSIATLIIECN